MDEENSKQIAENIKRIRTEAGLTMGSLAERIGVACSHISVIEAGKRVPKTETLIKIARALEVPLKALLIGVK